MVEQVPAEGLPPARVGVDAGCTDRPALFWTVASTRLPVRRDNRLRLEDAQRPSNRRASGRRTDYPDLVAADLSEPQVAIGPGRDAVGAAVGRGDGEFGKGPRGGDPADLVAAVLGEPQVAVGPGRDAIRLAGRGDGEFGKGPRGG